LVETVGAVTGFTARNGTISTSGLNSIPINTASASGTVVEDLTIIQPAIMAVCFLEVQLSFDEFHTLVAVLPSSVRR